MNERIRELLKQAEERYPRHLAVAVPEVVLRQDALEKFTELIVRECIECADNVGKANIASGYPNSTAHHVKQKIKQHFGVEL